MSNPIDPELHLRQHRQAIDRFVADRRRTGPLATTCNPGRVVLADRLRRLGDHAVADRLARLVDCPQAGAAHA